MKAAKRIAFVITIISGIAFLIGFFTPRAVDVSAVGIIGHADGPTSVFVAAGSVPDYPLLILFVLSSFAWLLLHFKNKNAK